MKLKLLHLVSQFNHSESYLFGYLEERKKGKVLYLLGIREGKNNPATPTFTSYILT
ncbi:hypothetical protein SAMN05660413_01237 [Salegentibacter flavus]|uniref:Uncharacterized protein n=1 Tax=Salegentibacter flavus TaxID=287099 RepID=A0A1I4ZAA2_9FLAO|nr:hypothetical protein SAMN05660413_01237 [Salegentibacter flavus]